MAHIHSTRIRLRAAEREDIPTFVRWINDPEVTEDLLFAMPMSHAAEEQWFDAMMSNPTSEHTLVIELPEDDSDQDYRPIGNCQFLNIDWRNRSSEVGIMIGEKEFWNQGFGTETMQCLLEHGFNTLNLHRIWLQVIDKNKRGIRAYEKAGFTHEGIYRQAHYQHGRYYDIYLMSVIKDEWLHKEKITRSQV